MLKEMKRLYKQSENRTTNEIILLDDSSEEKLEYTNAKKKKQGDKPHSFFAGKRGKQMKRKKQSHDESENPRDQMGAGSAK